MTAHRDSHVEIDGFRMRVRRSGTNRNGRPVVVLHGFTGSVDSMAGVVSRQAEQRPVLAVDLVGHGGSDSPADPACYGMSACVGHVAAAIDAFVGRSVHVLGYSMGGRVALSLAVAHPDRVASLLTVGASPGIADAGDRARRLEADRELARQIEEEGLARFVDYWMGLPLFASQSSLGAAFLSEARAQRMTCNPRGLAGSLRGTGTGSMPPLHDRLGALRRPVCLVAGAKDAKFVALAEAMRYQLPDARCELVEGVGHAAHLEDPDAFSEIASAFFAEVDAAPSEMHTR